MSIYEKEGVLNTCKKSILKFYKDKTGNAVPDDLSQLDFHLELNKPAHRDVLLTCKYFRLPDSKRVFLDFIPPTHPNYDLRDFLVYAAPIKARVFVFGWDHTGQERPSIDMYLDGLERSLKNVTSEAFFWYWKMSKSALQRVVRASSKANRIVIRRTSLDLDSVPDFTGTSYKTTHFSVLLSGDGAGDSWSSYPVKLGNLFSAIYNCDLRLTLKTFNIGGCGVDKSFAQMMLDDYGLSHITAVEE